MTEKTKKVKAWAELHKNGRIVYSWQRGKGAFMPNIQKRKSAVQLSEFGTSIVPITITYSLPKK